MQYECNTFEINIALFDRVGRVCYIVYNYLLGSDAGFPQRRHGGGLEAAATGGNQYSGGAFAVTAKKLRIQL